MVAVHRTGHVLGDGESEHEVPLGGGWRRLPAEAVPTVGDWVVADEAVTRIVRVLERKSVLQRVAAGSRPDYQLIGANVDTAFIVTSCNRDFNAARLHRYLALAGDAGIDAVLVITKADLCPHPREYGDKARRLAPNTPALVVNGLDPASVRPVRRRLRRGATYAMLGSSGVGKSTLLNTLAGSRLQPTRALRDDDKGRHTTTARSLHRLPDGALLLDGPGVRELGVADVDEGVVSLFDDIETLARGCRFADCRHDREPGCAVRGAIDGGELDAGRLASYRKLEGEQRRLGQVIAGQRHRGRKLTHLARRRKPSD